LGSRLRVLACVAEMLPPLVGGVFMLAAFAKAVRPDAATEALIWVVGSSLAMPALVGLIAFEGVLGVMLAFSIARRLAASVAAATLLIFSGFLVLKNSFGPEGDCGCGTAFIFGDSVTTSLSFNLARNGLLLAALLPTLLPVIWTALPVSSAAGRGFRHGAQAPARE